MAALLLMTPPQLGGYCKLARGLHASRPDLAPGLAAKLCRRSRKKKEWDRVPVVHDKGAGVPVLISVSTVRCVPLTQRLHRHLFSVTFSITSSVCFLAWQHELIAVPCPDNFPSPACGDCCREQRVSGATRGSLPIDISLHLKQFEAVCTLGNNSVTGREV